MKEYVKYYVFSLIVLCLCACNEGKNEKVADENYDIVSFATINLHDTTSFLLTRDDICNISVDMEITYPKMYVNKEKTEVLQRLFSTLVLGVSADSVSLATAFPQCMENLILRYKSVDGNYDEDVYEFDYDVMTDCKLSMKTYPIYNMSGLLGFCKVESVEVNGEQPLVRHFYYAFDLKKLCRIELTDLFSEENNSKVAEMLKDKLRTEVNVANDDELVDMGYYNIDNIEVVDNFYVTTDSIIWNYLPRELSVLDEVRISLGRNELDILSYNN